MKRMPDLDSFALSELERKILTKLYGDSPEDLRNHAKMGLFVYGSFEDFLADWVSALCDPEGAPAAFKRLDRVTIDGAEYYVDFVQ